MSGGRLPRWVRVCNEVLVGDSDRDGNLQLEGKPPSTAEVGGSIARLSANEAAVFDRGSSHSHVRVIC